MMKNKLGIIHFLPLLLITGLIIAVVGGIFYFNSPKSPLFTRCCDEGYLNESVESNTNDWETYVNSKQGYKFKYPADWSLFESINEEFISRVTLRPNIDEYNSLSKNFGIISINATGANRSDIDSYLQNSICITDEYCSTEDKSVLDFNGLEAFQIKSNFIDEAINTVFTKETNAQQYANIYINVQVVLDEDFYSESVSTERRIEIYNQIISTFEFIENDVCPVGEICD